MGGIKEGGGSGSCTSNDIEQLGENKRLLLYLCSGVIQTLYRSIDFVFASALPHHWAIGSKKKIEALETASHNSFRAVLPCSDEMEWPS